MKHSLQRFCCCQCRLSVLHGWNPLCLHLVERSSQGHVERWGVKSEKWKVSAGMYRFSSLLTRSFIYLQQAGLKNASRTGAPLSTWLFPAWWCCVSSGGHTRLEAFWQVTSQVTLWFFFFFKASIAVRVRFDQTNCCLSLTGLISEVELGAQAVVYELANVAYMVIWWPDPADCCMYCIQIHKVR